MRHRSRPARREARLCLPARLALATFLIRALTEVGGHHVSWNGLIHIDTGPRRPW